MSREQAAATFIDVLLGYRCAYGVYREAVEKLSEAEKAAISGAISIRTTA